MLDLFCDLHFSFYMIYTYNEMIPQKNSFSIFPSKIAEFYECISYLNTQAYHTILSKEKEKRK